MDSADLAYFQRRALDEAVAAVEAATPVARDRHRELEAAYRFRIRYADRPDGPPAFCFAAPGEPRSLAPRPEAT